MFGWHESVREIAVARFADGMSWPVIRHTTPPAMKLPRLAALLLLPAFANAAQLLVPLYVYPTASNPMWNAVESTAATAPVTAIVNANNGPGAAIDLNYSSRIAALVSHGVTVAGYVYSSYGARPIADVKADIDTWLVLYPGVTQLFIDEQSDDLATLAYYQELYSYAASKGYTRVFTNPGTFVDESFTTSPDIAVTSVLYEDKNSLWAGYATPSYVAARSSTDFATIVFNSATTSTMSAAVSLAKSRNFGYIYVTDDKGGNPYDKIPTYWSAETAAVYP